MKKNNFKPSGFNPTWIYGIIGLLLIAFLLFSDNIGGVGGTTKNIDRTTFLTYVEKGYVKEADLEKETGRVSVYLTEEALNNEEFKKFKNTKENLNTFATGAPNFTFNVADAGNFEKDFYENDELIAITKELTDTLRKNRSVDWQKRDSARAKMRMMIKR